MNCLIYLRVSTKEQAQTDEKEGYSIPAQREACLKYIREKGWNFVDEYVDRGESARSADRPQLQEMLSRVKKERSIDMVIVHKIDRLARNMEDHVAIKAILKRADASLMSVVENIEDTASGRLIEGIHALMAEFYSANLSMEVKKGLVQKAKNGGWPGKAPMGYKNEKVTVEGREISKIVVNEETAPFVKLAFDLYATGNYSLTELKDILEEKGLRTTNGRRYQNKPLSKSNLAKVLQNKFYIGIVEWKSIIAKGNHEPIISQDIFEKVKETLKINNTAGERKRKHPHYLKGTIYCGECGSRMSITIAKGQYPYFYCLGQKRNDGCRQEYVLVDAIEKEIEELYLQIEIPKAKSNKLKDKFRKEFAQQGILFTKEKEFHNKRIAKLLKQQEKLLYSYYEEATPFALYRKEQERIAKELADAEDKLSKLDAKDSRAEKVFELILAIASNCYEGYRMALPQTRRMFNQAFVKKAYIKGKKISKHEFTDTYTDVIFSPSSNKNYLAGVVGFEPTNGGSKNRCLTTWLHPTIRNQKPVNRKQLTRKYKFDSSILEQNVAFDKIFFRIAELVE